MADGQNCTVHVVDRPFPTVQCNSMAVDRDSRLVSVVCRDQVEVRGAHFFFGVLDPKTMKATVPLYNVTFAGDPTFRPVDMVVSSGVTYVYDFSGEGSVYSIPSSPAAIAAAGGGDRPQPRRIASTGLLGLAFLNGGTVFNERRNTLVATAQDLLSQATVTLLLVELDVARNVTRRTELKQPGDYRGFALDGFWGPALLDDTRVMGFLLNSTRAVADLSTGEVVTLCPECPALKRGASSAPSVLSADRRHLYYIGEPPMSRDFQPLGTPYLYTFSVDTGAVESTCVMPEDFAYVKAAPRPPRSTPRRSRRPTVLMAAARVVGAPDHRRYTNTLLPLS